MHSVAAYFSREFLRSSISDDFNFMPPEDYVSSINVLGELYRTYAYTDSEISITCII